jgi:hypothetical protein
MAVPVSKTKEQDNLASSSSPTSEVRNLPVFPPSCSTDINVQQGLKNQNYYIRPSQMPAQPLLSYSSARMKLVATQLSHKDYFSKNIVELVQNHSSACCSSLYTVTTSTQVGRPLFWSAGPLVHCPADY